MDTHFLFSPWQNKKSPLPPIEIDHSFPKAMNIFMVYHIRMRLMINTLKIPVQLIFPPKESDSWIDEIIIEYHNLVSLDFSFSFVWFGPYSAGTLSISIQYIVVAFSFFFHCLFVHTCIFCESNEFNIFILP